MQERIPDQKNFVQTVRAVELIMGIPVPGYTLSGSITTSNFSVAIGQALTNNKAGLFANTEVTSALTDAVPILNRIAAANNIPNIFNFKDASAPLNSSPGKDLVVTKYVHYASIRCSGCLSFSASWTSAGNTTTHPTPLTPRSVLLDTTTTSTTASV